MANVPLIMFLVFIAITLALYIALLTYRPRALVIPYLLPLIEVLEQTIGRDHSFVFVPVLCLGSIVMLGLPRLAVALLGGFLFRRYKVTFTRRG